MVNEFPQAQMPGEGGRQEKTGIGHQAVIVKDDTDTVGVVAATSRQTFGLIRAEIIRISISTMFDTESRRWTVSITSITCMHGP